MRRNLVVNPQDHHTKHSGGCRQDHHRGVVHAYRLLSNHHRNWNFATEQLFRTITMTQYMPVIIKLSQTFSFCCGSAVLDQYSGVYAQFMAAIINILNIRFSTPDFRETKFNFIAKSAITIDLKTLIKMPYLESEKIMFQRIFKYKGGGGYFAKQEMYRFYRRLIVRGMILKNRLNMLMKVYLVILRMGVWSVGGIPLVTVIRNTWHIILASLLKLYPCQMYWVQLRFKMAPLNNCFIFHPSFRWCIFDFGSRKTLFSKRYCRNGGDRGRDISLIWEPKN